MPDLRESKGRIPDVSERIRTSDLLMAPSPFLSLLRSKLTYCLTAEALPSSPAKVSAQDLLLILTDDNRTLWQVNNAKKA
jgi:hypothetical protein